MVTDTCCTITGVHSNQHLIWFAKIRVYMCFWVNRGSCLLVIVESRIITNFNCFQLPLRQSIVVVADDHAQQLRFHLEGSVVALGPDKVRFGTTQYCGTPPVVVVVVVVVYVRGLYFEVHCLGSCMLRGV